MRAAIRSREDSISVKTVIAFNKTLFTQHPFRREEGGTLESVERMTRDDVVNFYERLSSPSNMVLTVFGDIRAAEVLEEIKKKFSGLPRRAVNLNWYTEPAVETPREQAQKMDKEQAMVIIGFHGPSFKSEDRYGVEILADILGSSFSSRLFTTVREKFGQAYTLGGGFVPSLDTGIISFYVLTSPDKADAVKDLVMKEILKLRSELVSEKELTDIKMYLKGNFKEANQTSAALSFTAGLDELYGLGYDNYLRYDQVIDNVTAADVRRFDVKYFDAEKSVVVITRPVEKAK
jgi:zinc protease